MGVSEEEWRLYSGGQMLGDTSNMDSRLIEGYESTGGRNVRMGTGAPNSGVTAYLNRGQAATYDRYNAEWKAVDRGSYSKNQEMYNAIDAKYGVNRLGLPHTVFANKSMDQLYGYSPAGIGVAKNYYTGQYGTAEGFAEGEELETALTNVYGELQGPAAMGQGWMDLYHTYNKWEQEDAMFGEEMLGLQSELFPKAIAQQKAMMAAGGMKFGSQQWQTAVKGIQDKRIDVEAEMAERKAALEDTSVYKALAGQFDKLSGEKEMRGIEKTETRFQDVSSWVDEIEKYTGARYGYNSETGQQELISEGYWTTTPGHYEMSSEPYDYTYTQGTETGRLLYGEGEAKETGPSFDEFFQGQFGQASGVVFR